MLSLHLLPMVFSGGNDTQIASVSIGSSLDLTGFLRDVKSISRLDIPELKVKPIVDFKQLHDLNDLFDEKDRHKKKLNRDWKRDPITPTVDLSGLGNLHKELSAIRSDYESFRREIEKPIAPRFDLREFEKAKSMVADLQRQSINIKVSGNIRGSTGRSQTQSDSSKLEGISQQLLSATRDTNKQLVQLTNATKNSRQGLVGNVLAGFGQQVGFQIASGVQSSLKRNFGLDLRKSVVKATDAAAVPIKIFVTENTELQATLKKTSDSFGDRMREAGYKVGDGIVAALEENQGTIANRINAFTKAAIGETDVRELFQDITKEARAAGKEIGQALVGSPNLKPYIDRAGQRVAGFRETALRERALPLVQQRAAEILNQRRAKNSANLVTDQTEQFVIATGGYAGARGLSGARIAQELGKEFGEETVAVWVKNLDTDIPKESMGKASDKLQALLTSLAKPNIRGYSKDAVEIAAQALAALERNPDTKVKILGESGGGYPAEEAAKILEMMGAGDRVEYLGLGTPNFTARLRNAPGRKIISPDEYLGAETAGFYARYGFADVNTPDQQILGVGGHPYEHYRDASVAELQNFLYGAPEPLSESELGEIKKAAQAFRMTDTRELDTRQLEDFARKAYTNLQTVRRQLLVATEDTKDELQEIADMFQDVYVKASPEPREFAQVRQVVAQAEDLFRNLDQNRGIGAANMANQATKELKQYQKEFNDKYGKSVGTIGLKAQDLRDRLAGLIEAFEDPSLAIKPRTPIVMPEVTFDDPRGGQLEEVLPENKGFIQRTVEKAGNAIVRRAQADIEKIRDGIETLVVNRVNDQLMRVPGQPDLFDPSRQIGALDELEIGDYLKLARIGTEDTMRGLAGGTAKAYSIAKGAENTLFGAAPPLALLKGVATRIGLPIAAWSAAGALPGVAGAEAGVTELVQTLLSMPADAALTAIEGGMAEAIYASLGNIPLVGNSLAPAVVEAITTILNAAGGAAVAGGAAALTPVAGGQVLLGAGKTAVKSVVPALPEAQIQANKQLQAATEQQLKVLQKGIETFKALLPVNPDKANLYLEGMRREYPQIASPLDEAIAALPPSQRMNAGQELARLKGQLSTAQKQLVEAEKRASKLGQFVQGLAGMIANPAEMMEKSVKGIEEGVLEAQVISSERVSDIPALPDARANLQKQFNAIVDATAQQIKDLGEEFSRQSATLKRAGLSPEVKTEVAAAINSSVEEARAAIDEIIKSFGKSVPSDVRKAAQSARQRITKAGTSAEGALVAAKQSGVEIPQGFNEGVQQRLALMKQAGENLADAVIVAAENKLEIKSPSRVFQRIGEQVVAGFQAGLDQAGKARQAIADFLEAAQQGAQQSKITFDDLLNSAKGLAGGFIAFKAAEFIIPFLQNATQASLNLALELDRTANTLTYALGSSDRATSVLEDLVNSSQDLGFNFQAAAEGYAQFAAAVKDTPSEGLTDLVTRAVNQAAAVSGLNQEQTNRAYLALSQIAGKGVVSQEELRQQLAEVGGVFAGSTNIAARGFGLSTQAFNAQVNAGNVNSQEFLSRFSTQLLAETSGSAVDAADSAQASVNRLNNSVALLQQNFGKLLQPGQIAVFNAASGAIDQINNNAEQLAQTITAIVAALSLNSIIALTKVLPTITASISGLLVKLGIVPPTLATIRASAIAATGALAKMGAQAALFYAGFELAQIGIELFSDASDGLSDIADRSTASLEKMRAELEKTSGAAKQSSDDLRAIGKIGEFRDAVRNDPFMGQDSAVERANRINQERLSRIPYVGGALARGFEFINTPIPEMLNNQQVERQTKAFREQTDQILANTRETIAETQNFINGTSSDTIAQINQLDKQLMEGQSRLRYLRAEDPGNTEGIKKATAEEEQLLARREEAAKELSKIQEAQQAQVDAINSALEKYDDLLKNNAISQEDYNKATRELKQNLDIVQASQTELSDAIGDSASELGKVSKELDRIAARLQDAKESLQLNTNASRISIAQGRIAGVTPGQTQAATDSQNIQALQQQIAVNQAEISNLRNQLSTSTLQTALGSLGLNADSNIGTGELERRQGRYQEQDPEYRALDILKQARQLELETSDLEASAAEARAQAVESARSTAKEFTEFFRSFQRQSEDLRRSIEQLGIDAQINRVRTEFSRNLSAFGDEFFGDFFNSLNELFDISRERVQVERDRAEREIQAQRTATDNARGINQQGSNAYGLGSTTGQAVAELALGREGTDFRAGVAEQCANFVRDVFSQAGIELGVTSNPVDGLSTGPALANSFFGEDIGVIIRNPEDLMPGDIVGYANTYDDGSNWAPGTITHAGVYVGNDMIVDRSTSDGDVNYRPLDTFDLTNFVAVRPHALTQQAAPTQAATAPSGSVDINRLREAIAGQESGGDYSAVNQDSGALGRYQVMPENVPYWSEKYLGRTISPDEFINNPQLQDELVNAVMGEMLQRALGESGGDQSTAIRRVAAEWYSGQPDLYNDTTPQYYGGGSYPSIAEYTQSIVGRYGEMPATASGGGSGGTASTAQLNQLQSQNQRDAETYINASDQYALSEQERLDLEQRQAEARARRNLETGTQRIEQQNIELQREQQNLILQRLGTISPDFASTLNELRQSEQDTEDSIRALAERERSLGESVANLEGTIEFYRDNPNAPGAELLPDMEANLPKLQAEYEQLQSLIESNEDVRAQAQQQIIERATQTNQQALTDRQTQTQQFQDELTLSRTEDPTIRRLLESQMETTRISSQLNTEINGKREEAARIEEEIQRLQEQGITFSESQLEYAQQSIDLRNQEADELQRQLDLQVEINRERQLGVLRDFRQNQQDSLFQTQLQSLQNNGATRFDVNAFQRENATQEESKRYLEELGRIRAFESQGLISSEEMQNLMNTESLLNQLNLENINTQFASLATTINTDVFGAFQGFGQSFAQVISQARSGQDILKGLGMAFDQMASRIIENLINLGVEWVNSEVRSLFFPQQEQSAGGGILGTILGGGNGGGVLGTLNIGGAAPSGGGGGLLGGILGIGKGLLGGIKIPGFNEGGPIASGYGGGDKYPLLGEAGEFVIRKEAVKALGGIPAMEVLNNAHKMPKYATGGMVGVPPAPSIPRSPVAPSTPRSPVMVGGEDRSIDINYNVSEINSVRYVTEEQFRAGMDVAAKRGAQGGRDQAFRDMQRSPNIRRGLGI